MERPHPPFSPRLATLLGYLNSNKQLLARLNDEREGGLSSHLHLFNKDATRNNFVLVPFSLSGETSPKAAGLIGRFPAHTPSGIILNCLQLVCDVSALVGYKRLSFSAAASHCDNPEAVDALLIKNGWCRCALAEYTPDYLDYHIRDDEDLFA